MHFIISNSQSQDRIPGIRIKFPPGLEIGNGGENIYNIKNPPDGKTVAVGDGVADDTQAFIDAYNYIWQEQERISGLTWQEMEAYVNASEGKPPYVKFIIYIPDGTYKVTNTIIYSGPLRTAWWSNTPNGAGYKRDRIHSIRFMGQSRENTIIRLKDNTFTDKNKPKPVLAYHRPEIVYNWYNATNMCNNLTINTGNGNPGAIGVSWWGANTNEIGNIKIVSEDGQGFTGLHLPIGPVHCFARDITIDGFDYGIKNENNAQATSPTFEYITLTNQNIAGISFKEASVSIRKLESNNKVTAIELAGNAAQVVCIDSKLKNGSSDKSAFNIEKNGHLFVRNVLTSGYGSTVKKQGNVIVQENSIEEYNSHDFKALRSGQLMQTMNLFIEEQPIMPWEDIADWADVKDYSSIQEAFNSGKSTIVFSGDSSYSIGTINVPSTVKVILCFFNHTRGTFNINEDSSEPIFIHGCLATNISSNSKRTVVANLTQFCTFENRTSATVKLFGYAAVASTFNSTNTKAWLRNIDIEWKRLPTNIGEGNVFWVMGFKNEGHNVDNNTPSFYAHDGAILEILGGTHGTDLKGELIKSEDAHASVIANNSTAQYVNPVITEIWRDTTRTFTKEDFPERKLPTGQQIGRFYSFLGYEKEAIPDSSCFMSLSSYNHNFDSHADTAEFNISPSQNYNIISNVDWITVTKNGDNFIVCVTKNNMANSRQAYIQVKGCVTKSIQIIQTAENEFMKGYYLRNKQNGSYLRAETEEKITTTETKEEKAVWDIVDSDGGYVYLVNQFFKKKLQAKNENSLILTEEPTINSQWEKIKAEDGIYQFINKAYIDASNRYMVQSNNSVILKNWQGDASKWIIEDGPGNILSSINSELKRNIKIYLNPLVSGQNLNIEVPENSSIRIINSSGKTLLNKRFMSYKSISNTESWGKGVFFVSISNEEKWYVGKLIIV